MEIDKVNNCDFQSFQKPNQHKNRYSYKLVVTLKKTLEIQIFPRPINPCGFLHHG